MTTPRTLYRPMGLGEAELVAATDWRAFPPRRPEQPIFYPVLTPEYAEQIAREWNAPPGDCGYAGFVTEFSLPAEFLDGYEEHQVGGPAHRELWVPAEELPEFNRHIAGRIRLRSAVYGAEYVGPAVAFGPLKGLPARDQLHALADVFALTPDELPHAVAAQRIAAQLNLPLWRQMCRAQTGPAKDRTEALLARIYACAWGEDSSAISGSPAA